MNNNLLGAPIPYNARTNMSIEQIENGWLLRLHNTNCTWSFSSLEKLGEFLVNEASR